MKKVVFSLVALLLSTLVMGQGKFEFEVTEHDFGTVTEGELATKVFAFKNVGDAPIVISNVKASCGCTTPEWPKEPVMPGETGQIKAVYNSKNRPGAFFKTITITSNATEPNAMLKIKGTVNSEAANQDSGTGMGIVAVTTKSLSQMNVKKSEISFGKLKVGQSFSHKFEFTNNGTQDLVIQGIKSDCNCVKHKVSAPSFKPGESGTIELTYSPSAEGKVEEKVTVMTNADKHNFDFLLLKGKVADKIVTQSMVKEEKTQGW